MFGSKKMAALMAANEELKTEVGHLRTLVQNFVKTVETANSKAEDADALAGKATVNTEALNKRVTEEYRVTCLRLRNLEEAVGVLAARLSKPVEKVASKSKKGKK